jgi:MoaA/NifB/PqqE/SkfB family radical SAM enzyme
MDIFDFLSLETEVTSNNKIKAKAGGILGDVMQPFVDQFFNVLNGIKVIAKTADGKLVYNLYNPPQPSPAGMRAMMRKVKEMVYKHVFPATANLSVTWKCQCKCVHCSAESFVNKPADLLSVDELKTVVDGAIDLGANLIIYTGGEPLLRPEIYELIQYVPKDKAMAMIFTNGLELAKDGVAEKLAKAGLSTLNISIDHLDAKKHDEWRGIKGLYEKAFEGARRARAAGILTGVSTYATRESLNDGSVEKLINKAIDEGFQEVTIFDCIPSGKFLKRTEMMLTDEDKKKVIALARKYIANSPVGIAAQALINSPIGAGCFGSYSEFYMTARGDINPCDFNPISFGNVRELPVQLIWGKMVTHPDFAKRHMTCRMQTPSYRERYIDVIPDDAKWPVTVEQVEQWRAEREGNKTQCSSCAK